MRFLDSHIGIRRFAMARASHSLLRSGPAVFCARFQSTGAAITRYPNATARMPIRFSWRIDTLKGSSSFLNARSVHQISEENDSIENEIAGIEVVEKKVTNAFLPLDELDNSNEKNRDENATVIDRSSVITELVKENEDDLAQVEKFRRFYANAKDPSQYDPENPTEWLAHHEVEVVGDDPKPIFDLNETGFRKQIVKEFEKRFEKPTPIQSLTWPVLRDGSNLVAVSNTGSGKTLAFGLPALTMIEKKRSSRAHRRRPIALMIAPTRELAQQIEKEISAFTRSLKLNTVVAVGGSSKYIQSRALRDGCDILIGTPGRLIDHLYDSNDLFDSVSYLVLDEADTMLDMGFEVQIREILSNMKEGYQTVLYSATWPRKVRKLANDFLHKYVQVNVGSSELSVNKNITQRIVCLRPDARKFQILETLEEFNVNQKDRVLIFVSTKRTADALASFLAEHEFFVGSLHSDKSQARREQTLRAFRTGRITVLIATNVAARGLDIKDVKAVVNYDFPDCIEDYIHRIGRTGRAGRKGTAISYFTPEDAALAKPLVQLLHDSGQESPQTLMQLASTDRRTLKGSLLPRWGPRKYEYRDNKPRRAGKKFDAEDQPRGLRKFGNRRGQDRYGPKQSYRRTDRDGGHDFADRRESRSRSMRRKNDYRIQSSEDSAFGTVNGEDWKASERFGSSTDLEWKSFDQDKKANFDNNSDDERRRPNVEKFL